MFCSKCGAKITNESGVCTNCGQKYEASSEVRTIRLQCKNCNGIMEVDEEAQEVTCPYCGAREKILDSDAVAVEKIKSNTYKEMEFARRANEEKKEEQLSYKKSILCKATIVCMFICLLLMINAFKKYHILAGIIALVQIGLFALSWLMGMQIVKEKRKFVYMAFAILAFLLMIPFGMCNSIEKLEKIDWPDDGIMENLPDPGAKYGEIVTNTADYFCATIEKYSEKDYENYVAACQEIGYIVESETLTSSYDAYNEEGYELSLSYSSETMDIELQAPEIMTEFQWPDSKIAKLIPKPDSNIGKIESESDIGFVIYVGNTSKDDFEKYVKKVRKAGFEVDYQKENTYYRADNAEGYHIDVEYEGNNIICIRMEAPDEKKSNSDEVTGSKADSEEVTEKADDEVDADKVNPDLKAFLDDYEEFIDEYIVFMEKYNESEDTVGMLADYTDIMAKYAEFTNNLAKYDEEEMTPSDAAYYAEVTARCSKKLIKASL